MVGYNDERGDETSAMTASTTTLGDRIVTEMGRRGIQGSLFSYRQYQWLHRVNSQHELSAFLQFNGYPGVAAVDSPSELIGKIQLIERRKTDRRFLWVHLIELLFCLLSFF
jgi:hypothetical protein